MIVLNCEMNHWSRSSNREKVQTGIGGKKCLQWYRLQKADTVKITQIIGEEYLTKNA